MPSSAREGRLAEHLTRMDFIILDELGYLPFGQSGGQLLFHLVSRLYQRKRCLYSRPNEGPRDRNKSRRLCLCGVRGPSLGLEYRHRSIPLKACFRYFRSVPQPLLAQVLI